MTVLAVVLVAVAGVSIVEFTSSSGGKLPPSRPGRPQIVAQPKTVKLGSRSAAVYRVARLFVATAVLRRHLDQAYDIATPSLHEGMTKKQWETGEIPVVPYPAGDLLIAKWRIDYSYPREVGLTVAMIPREKAKTPYEAFDLRLVSWKRGRKQIWLVDSWAPAGVGIGAPGTPNVPGNAASPEVRPVLGKVWIVVPIAFLAGLIFLLVTGVFFREWRRNRSGRTPLHPFRRESNSP
jgi:hypothetical protein